MKLCFYQRPWMEMKNRGTPHEYGDSTTLSRLPPKRAIYDAFFGANDSHSRETLNRKGREGAELCVRSSEF
jgi:hypothetical protein